MKWIFIFRYCCLTAIKHCTTKTVCFQTSFGNKNNICAEQKTNLCFCVQYVCNVYRRRVIVCWLFYIQKNVILAVLLLLLQHWLHRSRGSRVSILVFVALSAACKGFWRCTCKHLLRRWLPVVLQLFFQSHPTLKLRTKEGVSSFPLCKYMLFILTISQ